MIKYVPKTVGIGKLQRQASSVLKKVKKSGDDYFVFSRNEPQVVIINLWRYEQLMKHEEEILPSAAESFKQGWKEAMEGKTMPIDTLWKDLDN